LVYLNIKINYLNSWDTFIVYGKHTFVYYIMNTIILLLFLILTKIISKIFGLKIKYLELGKQIIFPMMKGFSMAVLVTGGFVVTFYFIATETKFSSILYNFDGSAIEDEWDASASRIGMTVFMSGYFLLSIGINQSFKAFTTD